MRGVNHIALVTADFGRLSAFYSHVLGAEPAYQRTESDERAGLAFLRVGDVVLHVFERPGEAPGAVADQRAGVPVTGGRVDHVAFEASDADEFAAVRGRLIDLEATSGDVVDFGVLVSLFATDPDGSQVEVSLPRPAGWDPPFPLVPPAAPGRPERADDNEQLARRALEEIYGQGDLDLADELIHPDFVDHEPGQPETTRGPESVKQTVQRLRSSFGELDFAIEDEITEDDMVVQRVAFSGRHTGPLAGADPTGRPFAVRHIYVWRVADGQLVEHWGSRDDLGLLAQLGLLPRS